jgi:hypothetical protein
MVCNSNKKDIIAQIVKEKLKKRKKLILKRTKVKITTNNIFSRLENDLSKSLDLLSIDSSVISKDFLPDSYIEENSLDSIVGNEKSTNGNSRIIN